MTLTFISQEGQKSYQRVNNVTLPGVIGSFTVLKNHAPLIALLSSGMVEYEVTDCKKEVQEIGEGVAKVKDNEIIVLSLVK